MVSPSRPLATLTATRVSVSPVLLTITAPQNVTRGPHAADGPPNNRPVHHPQHPTPLRSRARCTGTPSKCNSDGHPQYYSGCYNCGPFSHSGGYWGCTKKWGCNEGWSVPAPRLSSQLLRPVARNIVAACLPAVTTVVTPIGFVPAAITAATPVAIFLTSKMGFPLDEAEDADRLFAGRRACRVVCLSCCRLSYAVPVLLCLSCIPVCLSVCSLCVCLVVLSRCGCCVSVLSRLGVLPYRVLSCGVVFLYVHVCRFIRSYATRFIALRRTFVTQVSP